MARHDVIRQILHRGETEPVFHFDFPFSPFFVIAAGLVSRIQNDKTGVFLYRDHGNIVTDMGKKPDMPFPVAADFGYRAAAGPQTEEEPFRIAARFEA